MDQRRNLNTADIGEIQDAANVRRPLAEAIVANRPYADAKGLLRVEDLRNLATAEELVCLWRVMMPPRVWLNPRPKMPAPARNDHGRVTATPTKPIGALFKRLSPIARANSCIDIRLPKLFQDLRGFVVEPGGVQSRSSLLSTEVGFGRQAAVEKRSWRALNQKTAAFTRPAGHALFDQQDVVFLGAESG